MADISKIQLPSGDSYNIKDGRIPSPLSVDEGKFVSVNSSGAYIVVNLPVYDGTVITYANGESF